jgi:hypothetical protein
MGSLLVIGEAPDEAANYVSDPEDGVNQHWLVIFLAHPVVLRIKNEEQLLRKRSTHLAGNGAEHTAVVVGPSIFAGFVGAILH